MLLVLAGTLGGLSAGWLAGGSLGRLSSCRLVGESWLLVALLLQLVVPLAAMSLEAPTVSTVLYALWMLSFPVMLVLAALNYRSPGFPAIALGILLNFCVIATNGGMPVSAVAMQGAGLREDPAPILEVQEPFHVGVSSESLLVLLADVAPIPGPPRLRTVVSMGDVLLVVGVASYLMHGMTRRPEVRPH